MELIDCTVSVVSQSYLHTDASRIAPKLLGPSYILLCPPCWLIDMF